MVEYFIPAAPESRRRVHFRASCSPRRMPRHGHRGLAWLRVRCWMFLMFDVERFFLFIGTSFIPHFGQLPGGSVMTSDASGRYLLFLLLASCSCRRSADWG